MKSRMEKRGSRGTVVVEFGSKGIDGVTIYARSEKEQSEAERVHVKLCPFLDEINKSFRIFSQASGPNWA